MNSLVPRMSPCTFWVMFLALAPGVGGAGCAHIQPETVQHYYFGYAVLNEAPPARSWQPSEFPEPLFDSEGKRIAARALVRDDAPDAELAHPPTIPATALALPSRADSHGVPSGIERGIVLVPGAEHGSQEPSEEMEEAAAEPRRQVEEDLASRLDVDGAEGRPRAPIEEAPEGEPGEEELGSVVADEEALAVRPSETSPLGLALAEAAEAEVGVRSELAVEAFIAQLLEAQAVPFPDLERDDWLRALYVSLKEQGLTYDQEKPLPGDLVFFHNTFDRNRDSRNNDWYTHCGIVVRVRDDGTVAFVTLAQGEVQEMVMNLEHPEVRRNESEGVTLNSFLRAKGMSDPEYTHYLTGELFAGFASLALP